MATSDIHEALKKEHGEDAVHITTIRGWVRKFKCEYWSTEDAPRSGRPSLEIPELYGDKILADIAEDPYIRTKALADKYGCSTTLMTKVLTKDLGLHMRHCVWVPKILNEEQKNRRVDFCKDFLQRFEDESNKEVYNIVTCDESYVNLYSTTFGPAAKVWTEEGARPAEQHRATIRQRKFLALIFFSRSRIIYQDLNIKKHTVTSEYYIERGIDKMVEAWKTSCPRSDPSKIWFHQDNAPPHKSERTMAHIEAIGMKLIAHPPYSPDLAPCDFWLFPRIKNKLRGKVFANLEEVKSAWEKDLDLLEPADFKKCFDEWIKRCKAVRDTGGIYYRK